jgi:hypothetical protein
MNQTKTQIARRILDLLQNKTISGWIQSQMNLDSQMVQERTYRNPIWKNLAIHDQESITESNAAADNLLHKMGYKKWKEKSDEIAVGAIDQLVVLEFLARNPEFTVSVHPLDVLREPVHYLQRFKAKQREN